MWDSKRHRTLVLALGAIVACGLMVPIGASHFWPTAGKSVAVSASAADKADPEPTAALDAVQKFSEAFRWVAKKVQPSVVAVSVTKSVEESASPFGDEDFFHRFFGRELPNMPHGNGGNRPHRFEQQGLGSGVIIEADGYILTNNHVVAGADEIKVHLMDGRDLKAKVIGTDPPTDLALIQVKAERLPALALGDSDKTEVGDWVLAIGAPFGLQETVTSGIISAKGAPTSASPTSRTSSRPMRPSTRATPAGRSSTCGARSSASTPPSPASPAGTWASGLPSRAT